MSYTFGDEPSDVVANSRGDVLAGVVLGLYPSKADAQASTNVLASVTSDASGRWSYTHATLSTVWVRTPAGSVYKTGDPDGKLDKSEASATYARKVAVDIRDYTSLKAAVADLPSTGGTVLVPIGTFRSGDFTLADYISKPNVKIIGTKMPALSATADRLENGSIIQGNIFAFAHGYEVHNIGVDLGKYVIDTYYGSADTHTTVGNPFAGDWTAFAVAQPNSGAPAPQRQGCSFSNVIALLHDSLTVGHAVLLEGMTGGSADNIIGVGGTHAVAVKSEHMRIGRLAGWSGANDCVILKSDSYAPCGNVSVDDVECLTVPPNTTPWFTPAVASAGGFLLNPVANFTGPVQVGKVRVFGSGMGLSVAGAGTITDVQIGSLYCDGTTGTMTDGIGGDGLSRILRFHIDSVNIQNSSEGVFWTSTTSGDAAAAQLSIGHAQISTASTRAFQVQGYGRVRIALLELDTVTNAYYVADTAKILVGQEHFNAVTTRFERGGPSLTATWANYAAAGQEAFDVFLSNYGVALKGALASSGTAVQFINTLPVYLKPAAYVRVPAYYYGSGAGKLGSVLIADVGLFAQEALTAPISGDWISLNGIGWAL